MISREEAIDIINEIVNADLLKEDYESALSEIASCIEAEMIGRHEWGVPDEKLGVLYVAKRSDLITERDLDEYSKMHKSLLYTPSNFEEDHINENVIEHIEDSCCDEATIDDVKRWFDRD